MALNASKIKGGAGGGPKQELIPIGAYPARVAQVLDLGLQPRKAWEGKSKGPVRMLWVTYELVTEFMKDEDGKDIEDKPRWISEKMNLFGLEADNAISTKRINGLDPTGELNGDWGQVGGFPCTLTVVHSKDGKYANIGSVGPVMKGMTIPELQNEPVIFDIDEPDMAIFEGLPDFLKGMMTSNLEFKGSVLEAVLSGQPAEASNAAAAATPEPEAEEEEEEGPPY